MKMIVHLFSAGFFTLHRNCGSPCGSKCSDVSPGHLRFRDDGLWLRLRTNNPDLLDVNRPGELPSAIANRRIHRGSTWSMAAKHNGRVAQIW
jgi:hypothetical protein